MNFYSSNGEINLAHQEMHMHHHWLFQPQSFYALCQWEMSQRNKYSTKEKKKIRVTHIAVISCRTKKGPNNEQRDWENRAFHVIRNVTWNGCRATVLVNHVFHLFTVPKSLVWTACLMKQALGTFILCYFIWEPICWFVVYHSDFPRWNFHSDPLDVPRGFWNLITKHLKWWHFF